MKAEAKAEKRSQRYTSKAKKMREKKTKPEQFESSETKEAQEIKKSKRPCEKLRKCVQLWVEKRLKTIKKTNRRTLTMNVISYSKRINYLKIKTSAVGIASFFRVADCLNADALPYRAYIPRTGQPASTPGASATRCNHTDNWW